MDKEKDLHRLRKHFNQSVSSSFHVSIASVNSDGSPWVTPIGSFLINRNGVGLYFEMFANQLTKNLYENNRVVVMGVNSGFWYWFKSIIKGKFNNSPALRLIGKVSQPRKPTEEEIKIISKRFDSFRGTRGHKLMWSRIGNIREVHFDCIASVNIGKMTASQ